MKTEHPALGLLTDLIEDIKTESASQNVKKEQTYAAQIELTNVPEDSLKQWTNMPPLSEKLYNELLKEFDNDSYYFFN